MMSNLLKPVSSRVVLIVLAALITGAVSASASTFVGIIDWDPPATAWTSDVPDDVDVAITNSAGDNWLSISFTNTTPLAATVSGSAANLFAGTWRSEYWIEFDFWADTQADSVQVRWGADGSTNIWGQTVTPSGGLGSWQTLRTDAFGQTAADWDIGLGNTVEYLTDLSSIDWIGVYIDRAGTGDENYGIDDFSLMVPEPAEVMLIAAAFGVGLLVWRRMRLVPVT